MWARLYFANGQIMMSELHGSDSCGDLYPPNPSGQPRVVIRVSQVENLQDLLDKNEVVMRCRKCFIMARMDYSRNKALLDAAGAGEDVPVVHPIHGVTRVSHAFHQE
jgi:hypothetical protein